MIITARKVRFQRSMARQARGYTLVEILVVLFHAQVLFYVPEALGQQIKIPQVVTGHHDVRVCDLESGYQEAYPVEHCVLPQCLVQAPAPFVLGLRADQDIKMLRMGIAVM